MLHGRRNDMFGDEEQKLAAHPIHSQLEEVLAEIQAAEQFLHSGG